MDPTSFLSLPMARVQTVARSGKGIRGATKAGQQCPGRLPIAQNNQNAHTEYGGGVYPKHPRLLSYTFCEYGSRSTKSRFCSFRLELRIASFRPEGGQCEAACGPVRGHERASCRRSRVPGCTRGVVWCDGRRQPGQRPRGEAPWPRRSRTRRDGAGLGGESESGSPARAVARILARARRATATARTRRGDRASGPPNPSARTETPGRRAMGRVRTRRRRRRTSHKPARGPSAAEADRWRASP